MRNHSILTYLGIGLGALLVACGGSSHEPTASSTSNLKGGDGGRGHACMPADGGTSPCARGDGGDQGEDEDGGIDDQQGDAGRRDGSHEDMDEGDGGHEVDDDHEGDGGRS